MSAAETGDIGGRADGGDRGAEFPSNVGADSAYYFTDTVGAGWLTRYSRGRLELP